MSVCLCRGTRVPPSKADFADDLAMIKTPNHTAGHVIFYGVILLTLGAAACQEQKFVFAASFFFLAEAGCQVGFIPTRPVFSYLGLYDEEAD